MRRQDLFCVFLTSVGLILSFPPFPTGLIVTVVLVPFFFYLRGKNFWEAFRGGYTVGLIWAGGTVYWIAWATGIGFLGVVLILPLYFAFFAVFQAWLLKRWGETSFVVAPFLWTGVEIISSWGTLGFPWNSLAYTQTYYPPLIQYVSITGAYGVTFWVVLLNVLFYFLLTNLKSRRRCFIPLGGIVFLVVLAWGHGRWVLSRESKPEEKVTLALVQGNIDPYKKWTPSFIDSNFAVYRRLTRIAQREKTDMIIWPETATPCYLRYRYSYLKRVKSQVDSLGIPLLTGSPDYAWDDQRSVRRYNGALLIYPNSWTIDRYYKMHLVPFSERVPFVETIPFLHDLSQKMDLDIGDFSPGDSVVVFAFTPPSMQREIRFSVVICYESVFPYLVRRFIKRGAQFLVVITNDGWFGRTSGPYQHAQIAVFRAIENRVWVVRCANTGISEFIDPFGRIQARTGIYEEAVLAGSVALGGGNTFFVKRGPFFIILILVIDGLLFLVTLVVELKSLSQVAS